MPNIVDEILFRLGVILLGLLVLGIGAALATNYRGAADWMSSRMTSAARAARSSIYYSQSRPIVFRLEGVIMALWGLAIIGYGVLLRDVGTPVGGISFGSLLIIAVLHILVIVVVTERLRHKRDRELKQQRGG